MHESDGRPAVDACPFRGLVPYSEDDADYFFGRDTDTNIIVANCLTTRLTLLYGASGVGKTSVLNAGVGKKLREEAIHNVRNGRPVRCIPVTFRRWSDDPIAGLQREVNQAVGEIFSGAGFTSTSPKSSGLVKAVTDISEKLKTDVLLILDQFEEHFAYPSAESLQCDDDLVTILNSAELRVNVVISIRDDSLARLDVFRPRIPFLFDNCLRLRHLTRGTAREAIKKSIGLYNERAAPKKVYIAPRLINQVVEQVGAGKFALESAGEEQQAIPQNEPERSLDEVEAPYLQIVMTRLWRAEIKDGSGRLKLSTLTGLGGAEQIVRTHLDAVMDTLTHDEQQIVAKVFFYLVTSQGKIAHAISDLTDYTGIPERSIEGVFNQLNAGDSFIVRDVTPPRARPRRFEIYHDLLAAPIRSWRLRFEAEAKQRQELVAAAASAETVRTQVVEIVEIAKQTQELLTSRLSSETDPTLADKLQTLQDKAENASAGATKISEALPVAQGRGAVAL